MSPLALLSVMAAVVMPARVQAVRVVTVDSCPAVQVVSSGDLGGVELRREKDGVSVSLSGAELGLQFSGASRFEWTRANLLADLPALPACAPIEAIRIERRPQEVGLHLRVPPESVVHLVRQGTRLTVVLGQGTAVAAAPPTAPAKPDAAPSGRVAAALPAPPAIPDAARPQAPPEPAAPEGKLDTRPAPRPADSDPPARPAVSAEAPAPEAPRPLSGPQDPVRPEPRAVETAARTQSEGPQRAADTAHLYQTLFSQSSSEDPDQAEPPVIVGAKQADREESARAQAADTAELYRMLFQVPPSEVPDRPAPAMSASAEAGRSSDADRGLRLGFLRLRSSVDLTYIDADATVLGTPQPIGDQYLEVRPRLTAEATRGEAWLRADYEPSFRGFAAFAPVATTTHRADANLHLPLGTRLVLRASDHFLRGVLEAQEADPGREFFFDLGRFSRNAFDVNARFEMSPRLSLELGGGLNRVSFDGPSGFFDYGSQAAKAGLGFELTPSLRAILGYTYDRVPTPAQRPEAESRAHSGQLTLSGDILPLVTGQLSVGYRDHRSPRAGEGGQRFQGLTASGSVTKQFSRASFLTVTVNRSTPVSAFEQNGFYVTTSAQAHLSLPLPWSLSLGAGAGYHWNAYRTPALDLGQPRDDRIFGWSFGLARPLGRWAYVSAHYRRERRQSNLDAFDNVTDALMLQLSVDPFGPMERR